MYTGSLTETRVCQDGVTYCITCRRADSAYDQI